MEGSTSSTSSQFSVESEKSPWPPLPPLTGPFFQEYDCIIRNQGIVQEVRDAEEQTGSSKVHYLPHHTVVRRDKQTMKLRIVYDASAKCDRPSLNECLYTGPKFDQTILDILLRFRARQVVLTADIEKAFLMISMSEKDCDVLRFL